MKFKNLSIKSLGNISSYLLPATFLLNSLPVYAEGSIDLVNNTGDRPYLEVRNNRYTASFLRSTIIKVSVQPGEWINLGSNTIGTGKGDIVYTNPSGTFSCKTTQSGKGLISTLAQESNGPGTGINGSTGVGPTGKYQPCLVQVGPNEGGIWEVKFIPPDIDSSGDNPLPISTTTQWATPKTTDFFTAAWDVTVRSDATNSGTPIKGRVYTDKLALNMGYDNSSGIRTGRIFSKVYILTIDGFIYKTQLNNMDPFGFIFLANNKGILDNGQPSYHSAPSDPTNPIDPNTGTPSLNGTIPLPLAAGLTVQDPVHKIFFNPPAADLETLPKPIIKTAINPDVTNVSFTGQISNKSPVGVGGTFKFNSNVPDGSYQLIIRDTSNKIIRVVQKPLSSGQNTFVWDGKDDSGNNLPVGKYKYDVTVRNGEYHFPLMDVENNPGGITFNLLNAPGPFRTGTDATTAFYDDRDFKPTGSSTTLQIGDNTNGSPAPSPRFTNADTGTGLGSSNYHKFGDNTTNINGFGNDQVIDTWIYFSSQPVGGDLIIFDTTPNITALKTGTLVTDVNGNGLIDGGDTIQYSIALTNTGTAAATGVVFKDTPDANTTLVVGSVTGPVGSTIVSGNTPGNNNIEVNVGSIAANATVNITYKVTVKNPVAAGTSKLSNQGKITGANIPATVTDDPSLSGAADPTVLPVAATVTASETVSLVQDLNNNSIPDAGDVLQYTTVVTATSTANNLVLTNPIPANTTYLPDSLSIDGAAKTDRINDDTAELNGSNVIFRLGTGANNVNGGTLNTGASTTVKFQVKINPGTTAGTIISSQGTVTGSNLSPTLTDDPRLPGTKEPTSIVVGSAISNSSSGSSSNATKADLSVSKSVSNSNPTVGSQVTYTIRVTNNGPDNATGVKITDQLPSGLTFVNSQPSQGTYNSSTGQWTVGNLANAASATLQITATVNSLPQTNNAQATGDQTDPNLTNNQAKVTVPSSPSQALSPVDLAVVATVDNYNPPVGSQVNFSVQVTNNGENDATGVQSSFVVPAGFTVVGNTPSQGTYNPATGIWTIGNLPKGATVTLQVAAVVNSPITNPQTLVAKVTSTETDINLANNEYNLTIPSLPVDLGISKTVDNFSPTVGSQINYTLRVNNNGPNNATGVKVIEQLPTGLTFVSSNPSQGNYNSSTGEWIIGNLTNGGVATLKITATVNAIPITNNAVVSGDQPDIYPPNNQAKLTIPVLPADVAITKSIDNATPTIGQQITYTLRAKNNGPNNATGVQVIDPLPWGLTFVSANASQGNYNPSTGQWSIDNLANGAVATLQITATVNNLPQTNRAIIKADQPDPVPTNNEASISTALLPTDLRIAKTVNNSSVVVGKPTTFTLQVTNAGPNDATGVQVIDQLPDGLSFVSATASQGNYNPTTGQWLIGNLANGAIATLQITANVNSIPQTNIAVVKGDQPDTNPLNNEARVTVPATDADLKVTKSANNYNPAIGQQVTYTVRIDNQGPNNATGVEVTDQLPSGLTFVSATASQGNYNPTTGQWIVGNLANGANATLQITATVNRSSITNIAQVTRSDQNDPNPANNQDGLTLPTQVANLSVTKTVDNQTVNVGGTATYTIRVLNSGPDNATGVLVRELLPSELTLISATQSQGNYNSSTGVWNVGNLANQQAATLQITAKVNNIPATNTAQVIASNQFDPNSRPNNDDPTEDDQASLTVPNVGVSGFRLVKRITAVTRQGVTTNFIDFVDDAKDVNDNAPGWATRSPVGLVEITPNNPLRSGDTIEYTIYFLSDGTVPAKNINFCDLIPTGTTFVPNSFNASSGIQLNRADTITPVNNTGTFFSPLAPLPAGNSCSNQVNPNGAVIINLGDVSNVSGQNYGFIRFVVTVD